MILNEVYFGDGPIKEMQNAFSRFRKKWMDGYAPKINYDSDLLKFNRLIEKTFGYYQFSLTVDPSSQMNAYMVNVSAFTYSQKDVKNALIQDLTIVKDANGFKYGEGNKVFAISCIFYGLISNKDITDRECVAIILHEIGHSFTESMIGNRASVKQTFNIFKLVIDAASKNIASARDDSMETAEKDVTEALTGYPVKVLKSLGNNITFYLNNFIRNTIKTLKGLNGVKISGLNKANKRDDEDYKFTEKNNLNLTLYGYTDEKFADTFAAIYGYGPDLHTALIKMEKSIADFHFKDRRVPNNIETFLSVNLLIFNDILEILIKDPHPDGLTRVQVSLEYAKKEIQYTNIDPKAKKALIAEIDEYTAIIDEYLSHKDDEDGFKIIRNYHIALYNRFGGDVRECVTNNMAIFKKIQNIYNELIKKVEYGK